jgi:hypothetical protein
MKECKSQYREVHTPTQKSTILSPQVFPHNTASNRRSFLQGSAALTVTASSLLAGLFLPLTLQGSDSNLNLLGPRTGFAPQIGTFVSMFTWMREANGVIKATKDLTTADLDYLIDPNANTIGALMLHLAATETYYQFNTFEGPSCVPGRRVIRDRDYNPKKRRPLRSPLEGRVSESSRLGPQTAISITGYNLLTRANNG